MISAFGIEHGSDEIVKVANPLKAISSKSKKIESNYRTAKKDKLFQQILEGKPKAQKKYNKNWMRLERINKAASDRVAETIAPLAPSTSVDVYRNSTERKKRGALTNWGVKGLGAGAGSLASLAAYKKLHGSSKFLNTATKISRGNRKIKIKPEDKKAYAMSGVVGVGGGAGGYVASVAHKKYVKNNPKYGYREVTNG